MGDELREVLLARYGETQARIANRGAYDDLRAPWPYYDANYAPLIADVPLAGRIVEIGCGHGSLLGWLRARGYVDVRGVDASPADVEFANGWLGSEIVTLGDAAEYLEKNHEGFDLVLAKAVLEHIPRHELLRLVRATAEALRSGGRVIVDVPNMDWLLAGHERYMDLTHESGFTRESLATLLALEFDDVVISGSRPASLTGSQRLLRPLVLRLLRRLLYVVGEGASEVLFASRSIVAVARGPSTRRMS